MSLSAMNSESPATRRLSVPGSVADQRSSGARGLSGSKAGCTSTLCTCASIVSIALACCAPVPSRPLREWIAVRYVGVRNLQSARPSFDGTRQHRGHVAPILRRGRVELLLAGQPGPEGGDEGPAPQRAAVSVLPAPAQAVRHSN